MKKIGWGFKLFTPYGEFSVAVKVL